ncbi:MAG: hypothetical protein H7274_13150 [Rhodoferax sp.]|nr:hypothetical protein [Rhodoferax sp.]
MQKVFGAIEWVVPKLEVVGANQLGWKFAPADAVAEGSWSASLPVGRSTPISVLAPDALQLRVASRRSGNAAQRRYGSRPGPAVAAFINPLKAPSHFLLKLRHCSEVADLLRADVVGTVTSADAWTIAPEAS